MSSAYQNLKSWFDKLSDPEKKEVLRELYGDLVTNDGLYCGPRPNALGTLKKGLYCGPTPTTSGTSRSCPTCGRSF